jgi:hypothetical protein
MNLRIHNPCNEHTRYHRNYNLFWDQFTEYLKKNHNIDENRYFEKAHMERFPITLQSSDRELLVMECEYIVEDLDSKNFAILSVADDLSHAILDEKNNDNLKLVLVSQFIKEKIDNHAKEQLHKYRPWLYFPSSLDDLEVFYNKRRKNINISIDRLFFRGTSLQDRLILEHLNSKIFVGPNVIGNPQQYFDDLIKHRIGLSVGGRGELCYRDIEYMAIGIPFLRFEFQTELAVPLIPNIHYISISIPDDLPKHNDIASDRLGLKHHAEALESRFMEVVNDFDFLEFVSNNARSYYLNYLTENNRIALTYNLLKNSGVIRNV